ncbi:MAG: TetR/AcrR family transcriptional regulator [Cyclobacteriaceae bacterium]|jgi:AcrR family transcriptional regulator|nr:TetR/AcrR family transcriptional regulator [Cyclobacteriaceae bacterium]
MPKAKNISTEDRIKEAAHRVFLEKGFSATTIRDVAKEAKSNVALVNYYFRSKKNLFTTVMLEKVHQILGKLAPILKDETITLHQKIDGVVNCYIDFLTKNPELPTFILNEIRKKNFEFISASRADKIILQSHFMRQLKEEIGDINPMHFFISLLGMIIFPFAAKPIMLQARLVNEKAFQKMMQERKKLIPIWVNAMLKKN